jgi:hypothetical protein
MIFAGSSSAYMPGAGERATSFADRLNSAMRAVHE